ncbi:MAG: class I SAM-dependent methyltransferase [Microthrixaceae bacterium]
MDLDDLGSNWDQLGELDPFWAVMSDRERRGNKWDVEEFFETGRQEIAELLDYLAGLGIEIGRARALDFGCGPGRLVQALADHFDTVTGIDIAASMLELAARLNKHGERCRYLLNTTTDLSVVGEERFDLLYTHLVLQHMEPVYARGYIRELVRLASPDGVVVFQVPARSPKQRIKELVPNGVLSRYRRIKSGGGPSIQMNGLDPADVVRTVRSAGGEVVHQQRWRRDSNSYRNASDLGYRYFVRPQGTDRSQG